MTLEEARELFADHGYPDDVAAKLAELVEDPCQRQARELHELLVSVFNRIDEHDHSAL